MEQVERYKDDAGERLERIDENLISNPDLVKDKPTQENMEQIRKQLQEELDK